MNRDNDMAHVRSAAQLREDKSPKQAVYGDSVGGRSFTDEESLALLSAEEQRRPVTKVGWRETWAGPGMTNWTIIDCQPEDSEDIEMYREGD